MEEVVKRVRGNKQRRRKREKEGLEKGKQVVKKIANGWDANLKGCGRVKWRMNGKGEGGRRG